MELTNHVVTTLEIEEDGELAVSLSNLPYKKGQHVKIEVTLMEEQEPKIITLGDLLASGAVGMWANRTDIKDSSEFSRQLRAEVETSRSHIWDDPQNEAK